jgi:hypothetical protein
MKTPEQREQDLRDLLAPHRGSARGYKYPVAVRRRVGTYVRDARKQGESLTVLSQRLEMPEVTLGRWSDVAPTGAAIKPVTVLPLAASAAPAPCPQTLCVVSPSGWKIEGLSRAEAVAILLEVGR